MAKKFAQKNVKLAAPTCPSLKQGGHPLQVRIQYKELKREETGKMVKKVKLFDNSSLDRWKK